MSLIVLKNVLFVTDLGINLFSVVVAAEEGLKVNFLDSPYSSISRLE